LKRAPGACCAFASTQPMFGVSPKTYQNSGKLTLSNLPFLLTIF
jgi:hypothetical protein